MPAGGGPGVLFLPGDDHREPAARPARKPGAEPGQVSHHPAPHPNGRRERHHRGVPADDGPLVGDELRSGLSQCEGNLSLAALRPATHQDGPSVDFDSACVHDNRIVPQRRQTQGRPHERAPDVPHGEAALVFENGRVVQQRIRHGAPAAKSENISSLAVPRGSKTVAGVILHIHEGDFSSAPVTFARGPRLGLR